MDLIVVVLVLAIVGLVAAIFIRGRAKSQEAQGAGAKPSDARDVADTTSEEAENAGPTRNDLRQRLRRRGPRMQQAAAADLDEQLSDEGEGGEDEDGEFSIQVPAGLSKKEQKKFIKKAQAKKQREIQEKKRRDKAAVADELERARAEKEAERAAEEKAKLEEEEKEKEEERKREQEEYDRLKVNFVVESGGNQADAIAQESQGLLGEFVSYIKTKKVLLFEDLAVHFGLSTQEAINRLDALEKMGRLQGVKDDRGKYIYTTDEELQALADFIRQRGRISIDDIVKNSGRFVSLEGEEVAAPPESEGEGEGGDDIEDQQAEEPEVVDFAQIMAASS
eukprot:m.356421 g.356421  ORF g.356421 m.356421 type:complete len:336 (-) comp17541_c0_seq1:2882-3889(-)